MFSNAELTLTLTAVPDGNEVASFIALALELGMTVTSAGPDDEIDGRFAVTVATGPDKQAAAVQRAFDRLMTTAGRMKG